MKLIQILTLIIIFSIPFSVNAADLDDIIREAANRNIQQKPLDLAKVCNNDKNKDWCEGYFSAVIASLESQGLKLCLPRNEVSRYSYDGVLAITKSWLYRQPQSNRIDFYSSVKKALTENENCEN